MESCGMNFIKYLLFIFNSIFAISGLGILTTGALVLSDVSDFNHFVTSDMIGPPIVLIVAGVIVFIVAFLGCFGAIRESYNMLMAFAGLLIVIFIVELAVGIAAAVYKSEFQEGLKKSLRKSMSNYSDSTVERIAWDNVQKKIMCCGVDGPNDWELPKTPSSCCTNDKQTQEVDQFCVSSGVGSYKFQRGCYERLQMKIESNTKILIGVGIGIAFVEVVGIVLACWLAFTIKREESSK